jgi:hypothetical protein
MVKKNKSKKQANRRRLVKQAKHLPPKQDWVVNRLNESLRALGGLRSRADQLGISATEAATFCMACKQSASAEQVAELLDMAREMFADENGKACDVVGSRALVYAGLALWFAPGVAMTEDVFRGVDELIALAGTQRFVEKKPEQTDPAPPTAEA